MFSLRSGINSNAKWVLTIYHNVAKLAQSEVAFKQIKFMQCCKE